MGFKSSVVVAQTTWFKRKLSNAFTPPAAPFNNTSFLIHLQQLRELHCSSPQNLRFDQYGSMDSMIACYSTSFATPASPQNHHPQHTAQSSNLSIMLKECSQNTDCSLHGQNSSDTDGRKCDSDRRHGIVQHFPSCSDDQSSAIEVKLETDPDPAMHEGDGMLTNRHGQHFIDDKFDIHA